MLLYVLFFKLKNKPLLFFIFNSNYRYGNKIEDKHKNVIVEINKKKITYLNLDADKTTTGGLGYIHQNHFEFVH